MSTYHARPARYAQGACGRCGKDPAEGVAQINDAWYCHGDWTQSYKPTCYEIAQMGQAMEGVARFLLERQSDSTGASE